MDIYSGLNENEIRCVEELANKGGRSYADIAAAVGISERQLYRIRMKPYIKKAVRERVMQELEEDIPDIISSLKRGMKKGDFRSTELLAKMAGLLIERREVKQTTTIEGSRYNGMSQEEIDAEISEIDNELKLIKGGVQ
ncbi:phBC6A51 family helix-turn-helix protein [Peribacillus butanolivorans]|uniref:phBC6A51 family helix-turn-helix protein n=1 Tax=Peribacillus butanolivorans TaxID=421767 RepID=UPI0036DE6A0C